MASGTLSTGSSTLFTPPANGVILTQVILANRHDIESSALITWFNGSSDVALIGNTVIAPRSTLMVELYVPLAANVQVLRGRSSTGDLEYTIAGMSIS